MWLPLAILGVLSVIGGWIGWPEGLGGGNWFAHFLDPVFSASHLSFEQVGVAVNSAVPNTPNASPAGSKELELVLAVVSTLTGLAGWFLAYLFYVRSPELPGKLARQFSAAYSTLANKYWVDEIYDAIIVRPLLALSRIGLWWTIDRGLVDGSGYAAAGGAIGLGALVRRVQSGNIRSYAGWLAGGAAALLLLMYFGFGVHFLSR